MVRPDPRHTPENFPHGCIPEGLRREGMAGPPGKDPAPNHRKAEAFPDRDLAAIRTTGRCPAEIPPGLRRTDRLPARTLHSRSAVLRREERRIHPGGIRIAGSDSATRIF